MNKNPNIIAKIPIIIAIVEKVLLIGFLMFQPINAADIPKKSKLKPTIMEINSDENIGKIMNSNPRTTAKIPALLLINHFTSIKLN